MNRILIVISSILIACISVGCGGAAPTIDQSWASYEELKYEIRDSENNKKGTATITTRTSDSSSAPFDDSDPEAQTKTVVEVEFGTKKRVTEYYAKIYDLRRIKSKTTDSSDPSNDYETNVRRDGKSLRYETKFASDPKRNVSGKLNIGKGKFAAGEFLYFFIRCHDISAMPASMKYASVSGPKPTVTELGCFPSGERETISTTVPGLETAECDIVSIGRTKSPRGASIDLYLLPREARYSFGEGTIIKSQCIPIRIKEGNLVYDLVGLDCPKKS